MAVDDHGLEVLRKSGIDISAGLGANPKAEYTIRVMPSGADGLPNAPDNPIYVQLSDGSINIGTVNANIEVQLSDQSPDPDVVRIGNGTNQLKVNADGSIDVNASVSITADPDVNIHGSLGESITVTGSSLDVNVSGGSIAISNFPATQTVAQGTTPWVVDGSGVVQPVSGTLSISGNVTVDQGTTPWIIDGSGVVQPVSGTVAISNFPATVDVTQNTSPWVISGAVTGSGNFTIVQPTGTNLHAVIDSGNIAVSGTVAVSNFPATQPVSGTVTALQGTTPWVVDGSGVTQPISGTVTAANQTLEVSGTGAALNATPIPPTDVSAYKSLGITITGTFTATYILESSPTGLAGSFIAVEGDFTTFPNFTPLTGSGLPSQIISIPVNFKYFQLRLSAYTSGTVSALMIASTNPAAVVNARAVWLYNASGTAAAYGLGVNGTTVLRTSSNISRNGNELSYNSGAADANTLRASIDNTQFDVALSTRASAANQTNGTQKSQSVDGSGNVQPAGDTNARGIHVIPGDGTNLQGYTASSEAKVLVTPLTSSSTVTVVQPTGTNLHAVIDSGTVTANLGTIGGAATEATLAKLPLAQASTTSGQSGPLIQGAVTTAAPTYTTAQTNPLSLTTAGALRVDGSAVTQPVSGTVTATPSGTQDENLKQVNGVTVLTGAGATGTGSQRVTVAQDSTTVAGSASIPAGSNTIGKVDQGTGGVSAWKVDGSAVTQPISGTVSGTGNFTVVQPTGANLHVVIDSGAVTVSGTVTSNIGTTGGLALDATVSALQVAQSSTTSGQKGGLTLGAVTTSAPSYTTAQTSPLSLTTAGALRIDGSGSTQPISGSVSVSNFPATQAVTQSTSPWVVSGTVTANLGTIAGVATETTLAKLTQTQGSTTSGQSGPLIQGAVTTAAPTYTTAQSSPLSLTTAGALRVDNSANTQPVSGTLTVNQGTSPWVGNISQFGGTNVSTGTGASGSGIPRVTISNDSKIIDTAPATQNITVVDSGSTTTAVANSQSFITGSATANSTASFALISAESVEVLVTGTWTGTLQSEISYDSGTTWHIRGMKQAGVTTIAAAFTANFQGGLNASGVTNYRVRATAAMTGTATVRIITTLTPSSISVTNPILLKDATTQSITNTIKAASTAAAATDTAIVVAFHPTSPTPTSILGGTAVAGTTVTVTTSATLISASDATWVLRVLNNNAALTNIRVGYTSGVTTTTGWPLVPGSPYFENSAYTDIYGIVASGTAVVSINGVKR